MKVNVCSLRSINSLMHARIDLKIRRVRFALYTTKLCKGKYSVKIMIVCGVLCKSTLYFRFPNVNVPFPSIERSMLRARRMHQPSAPRTIDEIVAGMMLNDRYKYVYLNNKKMVVLNMPRELFVALPGMGLSRFIVAVSKLKPVQLYFL